MLAVAERAAPPHFRDSSRRSVQGIDGQGNPQRTTFASREHIEHRHQRSDEYD
jgi:hypothetical protein